MYLFTYMLYYLGIILILYRANESWVIKRKNCASNLNPSNYSKRNRHLNRIITRAATCNHTASANRSPRISYIRCVIAMSVASIYISLSVWICCMSRDRLTGDDRRPILTINI